MKSTVKFIVKCIAQSTDFKPVFRLRLRKYLKTTAICLALGGQFGVFNASAQAAEIEQYQRKYISFYAANHPQFNQAMATALQQELPRFGFQTLPQMTGSLEDFAREVYAHQQAHAGELAANQELPDLRFGDKVISWAETRKIMNSAYVMVPVWGFGPLELKNLHQPSRGGSWTVNLVSPLQLSLEIYSISDGRPQLYASVEDSWDVAQQMPVGDLDAILGGISSGTGGLADPSNPLVQPLIIEALKAIEPFRGLLAQDPEALMAAHAPKALEEASYIKLSKLLRQLGAFGLKTQVEALDPARDQLLVTLPAGETAASLGAWLDQGYKIIEYQRDQGREIPIEVGFARVRQQSGAELRLQPLMGTRAFELGDQLIEYPQNGISAQVLAGTASFGLEDLNTQMFTPQAGVRVEISMARLSGISELYLTGSGGAGLLPLGFTGLTASELSDINAAAQALPTVFEVGLVKRWYLRQWMLEAGLQGGFMFGLLFNAGEQFKSPPTSLAPGLTALLGTGWQATPDLLIGLQGGWRYYFPVGWTGNDGRGPISLNLPGLTSNGPVVQFYGNYMF